MVNDYSDLYNFGLITLNGKLTFNTLLSYFNDTETISKDFMYCDKKITTKRKFTYKGGKMFQIKTNYLHVWIEFKNGNILHYRECKDGKFKQL